MLSGRVYIIILFILGLSLQPTGNKQLNYIQTFEVYSLKFDAPDFLLKNTPSKRKSTIFTV